MIEGRKYLEVGNLMNLRKLFFVMTLLIVLTSITALSAAGDDVAMDCDSGVSESVTQSYTSSNTEIVGTVSVKEEKSIKKEATTHVVTNETFNEYFTDAKLNDKVSSGDTLDMRGNFLGESFKMVIDKPINMISTTGDTNITVNSTGGSLMGDYEVNGFVVENGASGSNITGINFYNTQLYFTNVNQVHINNISSIVEDRAVGSGMGQTTIRQNSTNVTIENSLFKTRNNGGSSSLVLAWASNCILRNNTINASGNAGNCIYLTTYNIDGVNENETGPLNQNNTIIDNTIYGREEPTSICWGIVIEGLNNSIINNTIVYGGMGITSQWVTGELPKSVNTTIVNNTLLGGASLKEPLGGLVTGNYVTGDIQFVGSDAIIENNTFINVAMTSNSKLCNNIVLEDINLKDETNNILIANNNVGGKIQLNVKLLASKYAPVNVTIEGNTVNGMNFTGLNNSVIRNNNVNGSVIFNGTRNGFVDLLVEGNTIITDDDYAVVVYRPAGNVIIRNNYLSSAVGGRNDAVSADTSIVTVESNTGPKMASELIINPINVTIGEVATITAVIISDDSINDGKVYFKVNGKILRDSSTGKIFYVNVSDNNAVLSDYVVPSSWNNSTEISAVYTGGEVEGQLESVVVTPIVNVAEVEPEVGQEEAPTFSVEDVTGSAGETVTITINTNGLENGKVVVKVDGKTVKNSDGKLYVKVSGNITTITYTTSNTINDGEHTIKATYSKGATKLEAVGTLTIE